MKSILSLAKIPREDRHEKPNKERMKRNKPSRFLVYQLARSQDCGYDSLEPRDIVRNLVEEEAADQGHRNRNRIVRGHQKRVSFPYQLVSMRCGARSSHSAHL
jgi:hypothetical protein